MISITPGRSLQLYFIDGKPDGMMTAEVFNWTGHVLMTPRTQIAKALQRPQANFTGIYLLIGENEVGPLAYIGESEAMADRIKSHDAKKDWWSSAVLVTTSANNLNKAHVKYLESRLVEVATVVKRVKLDNGNLPPRPGLSEAESSNMESFLEYLLMVLPALRLDMFIENAKPKAAVMPGQPPQPSIVPRFELVNKKADLRATARIEEGDFIVEEGSTARADWVSKAHSEHSYRLLRKELEESGILKLLGGKRFFAIDCKFKSPSAAAAVIQGRSANGTVEWLIQGSPKTYKDWEAEKLSQLGTEG